MNQQISTNGRHGRFTHDTLEDEVESAKERLQDLMRPASRRVSRMAGLVREHPFAAISVAAVTGMLLARTRVSREAATVAAAWAVRTVLPRLLSKIL